MPARKPTSSETLKAIETVGAAAVCVGSAILFVTNPKFRSAVTQRLGALTPKANPAPATGAAQPPRTDAGAPISGGDGVVYLLKAGPFYKIGKAQQYDRRVRQIKLQLPFPVEEVHIIQCRDISHVERYWHSRFAKHRQNGEFFILTDEQVADFKSYATM